MSKIVSPGRNYPIVDGVAKAVQRFNNWMQLVSEGAQTLQGTATPEAAVEGRLGWRFIDTDAQTVYVKGTDGGDTGWINLNSSVGSSFASGTELLPGIAWTLDTDTGFYLDSAGDMRATVAGADVTRWTANTFEFSTDSGSTWLGVQQSGDVLDDLNTLGANSADGEFLVGTGSGALAWESGATARTSLGLEGAGTVTDNTLPRFDGTDGYTLQSSGVIIDDNNQASMVGNLVDVRTGTSETVALTDAGRTLTLNNASAITFTIPANASVAFPVGTRFDLIQLGAGQVTVAITSDTLRSKSSQVKLTGQYSGATLIKVATTTWFLVGDLSA